MFSYSFTVTLQPFRVRYLAKQVEALSKQMTDFVSDPANSMVADLGPEMEQSWGSSLLEVAQNMVSYLNERHGRRRGTAISAVSKATCEELQNFLAELASLDTSEEKLERKNLWEHKARSWLGEAQMIPGDWLIEEKGNRREKVTVFQRSDYPGGVVCQELLRLAHQARTGVNAIASHGSTIAPDNKETLALMERLNIPAANKRRARSVSCISEPGDENSLARQEEVTMVISGPEVAVSRLFLACVRETSIETCRYRENDTIF
jgi:hypothetical protein